MNKAEKIISLVLDREVYAVFPNYEGGDDKYMGAYLISCALLRHFKKHIVSDFGKTMFENENSIKEIERLLNHKVSFYCRSILHGDVERDGAERMLQHIKEQFTLIISQ